MIIVKSVAGVPVRLTDERWMHISIIRRGCWKPWPSQK
jgi:hypothetical protein